MQTRRDWLRSSVGLGGLLLAPSGLLSAQQKADLATLARTISEIVPADKRILPVGTLGGAPIRMGLYLADKPFPPQLINPVFTFKPTSLAIKMTEADKEFFSSRKYWAPHHLMDWIETKYDYILKPTYLYLMERCCVIILLKMKLKMEILLR